MIRQAAHFGLTPEQVCNMSPQEFRQYCEGVTDRREDLYSMAAWAQANVMTMWCAKGRRVRPDQLFKRRDAPPEFMDVGSMNEYMRKRIEEAEGE